MLMLDRYLVASGRALDLATGATVKWRLLRKSGRPGPALFSVRGPSRLIDSECRPHSRVEVWEKPAAPMGDAPTAEDTVAAFRAALADARDGRPRALDVAEASTAAWARTVRTLAREARLSGFVPLAADALGAVLAQARWRWPSWLKDRSLVIFATDARLTHEAAFALFRLATRDARPHLVVRAATPDYQWRDHPVTSGLQVHEVSRLEPAGPLGEGLPPIDSLAHRARELLAAGRVTEAEASARWCMVLAPPGSRQADARCALARSLLAQGRALEARAILLQVEGAEADVLRAEMLAVGHDPRAPATAPALTEAFLDVLGICQDLEDPASALGRVTGVLRDRVSASSVAMVAFDRGVARILAQAGATIGAPDLEAAVRAFETGLAVPAIDRIGSVQAAWPVRYGSALVGAVWCHWPLGLPIAPDDVHGLARLVAMAAAPAVHAAGEQSRAFTIPSGPVLDLIGESRAMQAVRLAVVRAAASPFPVLIEGESGAGKELVAQAIHAASTRRARRFCALNCAALADDLVEAELFGHAKGAFTGAVAERVGLFEEAQGGTLFLDEVAELGVRVQAKLLRVLQEGEIRRLGESSTRRVDARIVAATNRPRGQEAAGGRFRNDLRYRLDVLRIAVPPLRERLEDVPLLVRHVWRTLARRTGSRAVLSPSACAALGAYDWPGNVRELQNVLASIMVAAPPRGVVGPQGLPRHVARAASMDGRSSLAAARRAFEARYVQAALARAGGRLQVAAADLGVSRQGLSKLMARLDLETRAAGEAPSN